MNTFPLSQIIFSIGVLAVQAFQPPMTNFQYAFLSTIVRPHRVISKSVPAGRNKQSCGRHFMIQKDDIEQMQPNEDNIKSMIDSLLDSSISRAISTISNNPSMPSETRKSDKSQQTGAIIDAVISRASDQIKTSSKAPPSATLKNHKGKRSYLNNPAVNPTALGHSLWLEVIQPYQDTVIDATAGNGKDSLTLSKLLFPSGSEQSSALDKDCIDGKKAQLISIDIQQLACEKTLSLLEENFDSEIIKNNVQVLHQSHAPMPSLSKESVGLICYNLGYLPGADKEAQTQMTTTIYSLADSALLIRPGGLLSVLSYPGNGWKEHCAVSYFMEGLAMFTTRKTKGWVGFVDSIPSDYVLEQRHISSFDVNDIISRDDDDTVRQAVKLALERVKSDGFEKQTWRVFDHRPLGRPLSPILFSGMRIK